MYEIELQRTMSPDQRMMFQSEFSAVRKDPTVAILFAIFLGGVGAHHFYLGRIGLGVLYLLFFWTFIPSIVALFECFVLTERVNHWNDAKAIEIANRVRMIAPAAAAVASAFCTKCGMMMARDAQFCSKCGFAVPVAVVS